jgi:cytochrome c oxidase subunit IV
MTIEYEPQEEYELSHHPRPRQYVNIAVILGIITAVEVAIFYLDALSDVLVPALIVLSLAKFVLVVSWFMHLRFDSKIFRRLFVAGLLLALSVFLIVLTIFAARGGADPAG